MPLGRVALAEWLSKQMHESGFSTRDVARRSGAFKLSNGTVWNAQHGRTNQITDNTLLGLACAFEVSEAEVFAIYRCEALKVELDELRLVEYFKALPSDKKADVLLIVESLYKRYGKPEKVNHT